MSVAPQSRYDNLPKLQSGDCIDVDKKGNFVVKSSSQMLWQHVYDPQKYASKVMTAVLTKLESATDEDEIKSLREISKNVSIQYRELSKQNRLRLGKAKIISVLSKACIFQVKARFRAR